MSDGATRSANGGRASRGISVIAALPISPRATAATGVAALVVGIVLASVAGATGATAASAGGSAKQLTWAVPYASTSHDPALGLSGDVIDMTYDYLIYQTPSGKLVPQLATSWRYVGKSRRTFVIKLRKGVRFSDGSPMTAQVVKDSLLYSKSKQGTWSAQATYDSVKVTGPLTLTLHLTKANPLLPRAMARPYGMGTPICPAFLRDKKKLTTQTCGAGPYTLDVGKTIPGSQYELKPNPYYWNKSAIHYQRIVIKVISNPNSLLSALRTGQADIGQGDGTTVAAARAAGLKVDAAPSAFTGIQFQDVNGTLLKPLGDIRVRQALNYAIDRAAITKAVFPTPGLATPTHQPYLPVSEAWNSAPAYRNRYPYNPTRAKQLLAAAGYANGFTIEVVSTPLEQLDTITQAIASYWDKVGVTLKINSNAQAADYGNNLNSGKYPAYAILWGASPALIDWYAIWAPNAASGRWATFKPSDARLNSLVKQAERAPEAAAAKLWQQFGRRLTDLAWFVPVAMRSATYYSRPSVAGVVATNARPIMSLRELRPSGK
jgi:peptide/nickel transport system substrate-binding protein